MAVGAGTALFVNGTCFCPAGPVGALELVVNGRAQPVMAHGMPRLDLFRAQHPTLDPFATDGVTSDPHSPDDPRLHSYSSGFWGIARVPAGQAEDGCELSLRARLEGGGIVERELARIPAAPARAVAAVAQPEPSAGPLVAICMATFDPAAEMLRRQIDSIRAQTHGNWVCVISDDCSRPDRFAAVRELVAGDPRFVVSRSPRRLGFYRNFERALGMSPADATFVAMADQDDLWHHDKLETLLGALGKAQLVYSDARIVAPDGEVVSGTYWTHRANNHSSMASLLVANCVTGAASLFRRELLERALPFPPAQFGHFHDHWVALIALALGEIAFVERPLYDYVQHGDAVIGHAAANGLLTVRHRMGRVERLKASPRERVVRWRMTFFVANCQVLQYAVVLQMRCGPQMSRAKRRIIQRFLAADRSLGVLVWLWLRGRRELRGRPETLGAEMGLLAGFLWRRALSMTARRRPTRRLRMDALPPLNLVPGPRARQPTGPLTREVAQRISPLAFGAGDDVPVRVNLLVSSVEARHFADDRLAVFHLARRLTDRGLRVRIVTTDPTGPLPRAWGRQIESQPGLESFLDRVEVVFGREVRLVEASRSDRFVATTWRTAHLAQSAARSLGGERFLYVIQDYEPADYPAGSHAALAGESYAFDHFALFSGRLLRDYFARNRVGVYEAGREAGDRHSLAFQSAVAAVDPPSARDLSRPRAPSLLFHARPEPGADRHAFELGVLGLDRALEGGAFKEWALHGFGTNAAERRIAVGGGSVLEVLPIEGRRSYAEMLRAHDVGLAFMCTPHPGPVPIEMASAGMLTVTNSFEDKTPEAMAEISPNLMTVEPTVEAIAAGLREVAGRVEDLEARARGSHVSWSRDWDRSFEDPLMDRLVELLTS